MKKTIGISALLLSFCLTFYVGRVVESYKGAERYEKCKVVAQEIYEIWRQREKEWSIFGRTCIDELEEAKKNQCVAL